MRSSFSPFFILCLLFTFSCNSNYEKNQPELKKPGTLHSAVKPLPNPEESIQDLWMPRHNAINKRIAQGNVDLIFIGNSIINGFEDTGKEIWDSYYRDRNAVNMGFGWDRTQHVLWRLKNSSFDNISPRLVILLIGTNNIGHNTEDEIVDGISTICTELETLLPQTKILVLGILPRYANDSPDRQIIKRINTHISRLADNKTTFFLDIGAIFLDENLQISKNIMSDLLHPTLEGYSLFAEAIEPEVKALLKE